MALLGLYQNVYLLINIVNDDEKLVLRLSDKQRSDPHGFKERHCTPKADISAYPPIVGAADRGQGYSGQNGTAAPGGEDICRNSHILTRRYRMGHIARRRTVLFDHQRLSRTVLHI